MYFICVTSFKFKINLNDVTQTLDYVYSNDTER